jgi:hypothetical protein
MDSIAFTLFRIIDLDIYLTESVKVNAIQEYLSFVDPTNFKNILERARDMLLKKIREHDLSLNR